MRGEERIREDINERREEMRGRGKGKEGKGRKSQRGRDERRKEV